MHAGESGGAKEVVKVSQNILPSFISSYYKLASFEQNDCILC
uniref:Uncharacterized protein n=1 Tax=Parascaris equorum TaxID=6256 RepID=A0A914RUS8_PAREQ